MGGQKVRSGLTEFPNRASEQPSKDGHNAGAARLPRTWVRGRLMGVRSPIIKEVMSANVGRVGGKTLQEALHPRVGGNPKTHTSRSSVEPFGMLL